MDKVWYYAVEGERHGPVTFDELRSLALSGQVKPLDLVWQPEFGPDWRNAAQVRGLFEPENFAPPLPDNGAAAGAPLTGVIGSRPSCAAAVSQAFAHTVTTLFRPFDPTRWFSIGFCAWLAYIGTQLSFNPGEKKIFGGAESAESMRIMFDALLDRMTAFTWSFFEVIAVAFTLLLALLFCKLRSRGDFMLLHRWYRPDESIRQCWSASRAAGQELFVWRVYLFMIVVLLLALNGVLAYGYVIKPYMAAGKVWGDTLTNYAAGCVTAAFLTLAVSALVSHLTKAFVVPVMYWHGISASRAWLTVFALCNQYPFAVIGYLFCGVACAMAAGLAVLAIGLLTCCLGFIPFMLPYFGAVAMLPYFLFFRGYPVCFLNQWRPDLVPASA